MDRNLVLVALNAFSSSSVLLLVFFTYQTNFLDYLSTIQEAKLNQEIAMKMQEWNIEVFDYIIVGGGTAGCVVANRLSENPKNKVLLLERGGDPNPLTLIPALTSSNLVAESKTIAYVGQTSTQSKACLNQGGNCSVFAGRGLGGSTNINGMVYIRGSPQIFDLWSEITKDDIWAYKNVLKYFKKSEDYDGYYQPIDTNYHGTGGEWYIGNTERQEGNPATQYFFNAAENSGFSLIDINNGAEARTGGYSHMDFYIKSGQRFGTYSAFLEPVINRTNLNVYRYSRVFEITLNKAKRATGVLYIQNGVVKEVVARKEVILSAGALGSAELLMRSGIGPSEVLESIGIPARINLPVGKTLIDQPSAGLVFSINKTLFYYPQRDTTLTDIYDYVNNGSGNIGNEFSSAGYIFAQSSFARNTDGFPDLELFYSTLFGTSLPSLSPDVDYFSCNVGVVGVKSIGEFRLLTRYMDDKGLFINPNYFGNPEDLQAMIEGLTTSLDLFLNSPEFQALGIKFQTVAACDGIEFNTTDYWTCYIKEQSGPSLHYTGTSRMGFDDKNFSAVVNSKLKVFDIGGLRVVDASIMPISPNAHTSAATVMIAEVGAELILNDPANN